MDPSQDWRECGEPERDTGSTTTRYLEILSLERRSVLWVFRRGTWVQHETQPGALGSFSPPLQNKPSPSHPAPNSSLADMDLLGITPQNQFPPVLDRQSVTAYPRFSFLVWIIIFFFLLVLGFQRKTYLWAPYQGIWLIRHPQTHRYLFKSASCYVTWQLPSPCVSPADKYL